MKILDKLSVELFTQIFGSTAIEFPVYSYNRATKNNRATDNGLAINRFTAQHLYV